MSDIIPCCPYRFDAYNKEDTAEHKCPYFKRGKLLRPDLVKMGMKSYEQLYSCEHFYDDGSLMHSDPCCGCKERIKELSLDRNRYQCKHRLTCKMWEAKDE